jgi:NitT/TauT family transport system ATP-binding protein
LDATVASRSGTRPAGGIRISRLCKTYVASGRRTEALRDIDLDIRSGEFIVLLGRSGCGKSTLLRTLGGLLSPTTGSVTFDGKPLYDASQKLDERVLDSLGFVFQDPNLLPWRSVGRNIALPLEVQGMPAGARAARARELAESVGLAAFLEHLPSALSGGMRQRAAIARALAANPDVLLMDEPFGALDAMTRDDMNLMLQDIWMRERKTVVLVTHSITEAALLADRVVILTPHPGRIQRIVDVKLPRPRGATETKRAEYTELTALLRQEIGEA